MKRSEFLAFLPSISALPFMGSEFIKNESGILIKDAKIVESKFNFNYPDISNTELRIYQNGSHVGSAVLTHIDIEKMNDGSNRCFVKGIVNKGIIKDFI